MVVALGELPGEVFGEDIVAGRGQTVAAHAAVVAAFVGSLPGGAESDDDVASCGFDIKAGGGSNITL